MECVYVCVIINIIIKQCQHNQLEIIYKLAADIFSFIHSFRHFIFEAFLLMLRARPTFLFFSTLKS